jgi:two-component system, OmpR family, sensor kinase
MLARADAEAQKQDSTADDYRKKPRFAQLVDLDSLLLEVFRQYQPAGELDERGSPPRGPHLSLQHTTPVQVYGDADQLKQVLIAMLSNAFKYTPDEGSVFLSLDTLAEQAVLKVRDTGIGIAPKDLPHIFERFYRAARARSRDRGGSGLGLAIAQSIVLEHQGSIAVVSVPGKGSTFTVTLPLAGE